MSYRGIKRVLGESSLERKIRLLLVFALLILIGVSFFWVNQVTEDLILKNTQDKARGLTSAFLLEKHLTSRQTNENVNGVGASDLFKQMNDFISEDITAETLMIDRGMSRWVSNPTFVTDPAESEIVSRLVSESRTIQEQQDRIRAFEDVKADPGLNATSILNLTKGIFEGHFDGNNFVYYTPVVFKSECTHCHFPHSSDESENEEYNRLLADATGPDKEQLVFERLQKAPAFVMKITLLHDEAKAVVHRSRAILFAVGISTAFLSMMAMWLIVRYVIVKPLKHLQDVTDEVSHGRMDVRAELNTGDDFEELSRSLNRMLRHLLDTQIALQSANEDLDRKVDEQAQLNLNLHEMNQVKSEFLATMGHELRTPLNSIIGFSEILEGAKGLEEKQQRFASNIRTSGRILLDLINDILDLAKLEAGKMEVNPIEFPIAQLVSELCDMVRQLAESKNIQLMMCVDDDLPDVFQDQIKVRQILTNLLSNAIKFTPEGGRINVTAKRLESDELELQVQDTGVGIAESDQAIVFEKFRQGPSAIGTDSLTREVSGTGLGLSIVKEICILLGGKIELESEVGKGSTFTVTIPWNVKLFPKIDSQISQTLDEITKQNRVNFDRANKTPTPTREDIETASLPKSPVTSKTDSSVSPPQINQQ